MGQRRENHNHNLTMDKIFIEFIVDKTVFYKDESRWGVFLIRAKEEIEGVTTFQFNGRNYEHQALLTGEVGNLEIGTVYEGEVTITTNQKYGNQLKAVYVKRKIIEGEKYIKEYLRSFLSMKLAKSVASAYPDLINDVIKNGLKNIEGVPGIAEKMSNRIIKNIKENYLLADLITMLGPLGVTQKMIEKIGEFHKDKQVVVDMLLSNPYQLTRVHGLGFKKVDQIALKLNPDIAISVFRVKAFVDYILKEEANSNGSTLVEKSIIDAHVSKELPNCFTKYAEFIGQEKESPDLLHFLGTKIGLRKQYKLEKAIFETLKTLDSKITYWQYDLKTKGTTRILKDKASLERLEIGILDAVKWTNDKNGYELTTEQTDAVLNTIHNNVSIISGAAGTGKSSVIDCILRVYRGQEIKLCALSAKAAQRMTEITGRYAATIHRTLEFGGEGFKFNESNPIPADIIIVDEASMINSYLFMSLLRAIKVGTKLVIVFDYAQLPPIGAGNIASDLLQSNFSSVRFTKVHRQAEKSGILMDATKVRNGITPIDYMVANTNRKRITHGELQDMHFYFRDTKEEVNHLLINGFMGAVASYGLDNVFIVLPRKGIVTNSTEMVNFQIQDKLIPSNMDSIPRGKGSIRKGARVIQRKNDYEKNVVNGEIGYMKEINIFDKTFTIEFADSKKVDYEFNEIGNIELAYALTVHSFQGSQAKVILIGLDTSHFIMLDSFLFYTAITRAQKVCMVVSMPEAFKACIKNTQQKKRNTFLQQIISGAENQAKIEEYDPIEYKELTNQEIEEI